MRQAPRSADTITEQKRRAVEALERAWPEFRRSPRKLVESGLLFLPSPYQVTESGLVISTDLGANGMISPMRPNSIQKLTYDGIDFMRSQDLAVSIIANKPRRAGFSTGWLALFFAHLITRKGVKAALMAHMMEPARQLLQYIHTFYDEFSLIHPFVKCFPDSESEIGFESRGHNVFDVVKSKCVPVAATPKAVEGLRSQGVLLLGFTEVDFYQDPEAVVRSSTATLDDHPEAVSLIESTVQGKTGTFFGDTILDCWEAQGRVNFWDRDLEGKKLIRVGRADHLAMFFPFYVDLRNVGRLMPGVSVEEFEASWDDREREVYRMAWQYHFHRLARKFDESRNWAVGNVAFRRARLQQFYKAHRGMVRPSGKIRYASKQDFESEYPTSLEEALGGAGDGRVFVAEALRHAEETVRDPIWRGRVRDCGQRRFRLVSGDEELWLWKWPWECDGLMHIALDPNEGQETEPEAGREFAGDFNWAFVKDMITGEQIMSYVSKKPHWAVVKDIVTLARWMGSTPDSRESARVTGNQVSYGPPADRRAPWLTPETTIPTHLCHEALSTGYPAGRLYREQFDSGGQRRRGATYGLKMQNKKEATVRAAQELLETARRTREMEGGCGMPRTIIRDRRILEQMRWFVRKERPGLTPKFQAANKSGRTEQSIDDGVVAMCIEAYAHQQLVRAGLVEHGAKAVDGEDEGEPEENRVKEAMRLMLDGRDAAGVGGGEDYSWAIGGNF